MRDAELFQTRLTGKILRKRFECKAVALAPNQAKLLMDQNPMWKQVLSDFNVGQRIRSRWREWDHSQTIIGNEIGVSFKQAQKYEN